MPIVVMAMSKADFAKWLAAAGGSERHACRGAGNRASGCRHRTGNRAA